jgi:hypothetical protein
MIPIYLEKVDISGYFLGTSTEQKKAANFIRRFIQGNCVPPPDQGFFQGSGTADFERNMQMLIGTIKKTARVDVKPPPTAAAAADASEASKGAPANPQRSLVRAQPAATSAPLTKGDKLPPRVAADASEKVVNGRLTNDVCDRVASGEITTVVSTGQPGIGVVRRLADALKAPSCRLVVLKYVQPTESCCLLPSLYFHGTAPTFCYHRAYPLLPCQHVYVCYQRAREDRVRRTYVLFHANTPTFCYRRGNNIPIIPNFVTPFDFSLNTNDLGPEGGMAISEALKVNKTIKTIK